MDFRRLEDANVDGKTALVRVDFNVPLNDTGGIVDDTRLRSALPTIHALQEAGAKVVLLSHFGRPKGAPDPELSLRFIIPALAKAVGSDVYFTTEITQAAIKAMPSDGIMLAENTRFNPGETKGDGALSKAYAELGDVFVADAFSVTHRDHSTSAGIAKYLPAYAGLALEREIDHISQALEHPRKPVMGVVGGAKVSTKINLLKNLVNKLDILAIGGGMANTFLYAQGYDVGRSLCEKDLKATALEILENAKKANCRIILPIDVIAATEFKTNAPHRVCGLDVVKSTEMILDAGPETVEAILDGMDSANTLIWNGPLGAFEIPPFDTSSVECAKYAAKLTRDGKLISVAGGGDTVAALNHAGVADDFTFISTAGGAFLEWMEGKPLPGIEILRKK